MQSKFDQVLGKAKDFLANNKEMLIGGLGGGLLGGGATYMLSDDDKDALPSDLLSKRLKKALFGALLGGAAGTGAGYIYKNIPWDKILKKVTEALNGPPPPPKEDKSYKAQAALGAAGGGAGFMASKKISGEVAQDASDRQVSKASKNLMNKQLAADALNEKYKFNATPGMGDLLHRIDIAEGAESKIPAIKDLLVLLADAEWRFKNGWPYADLEIDAIKAKMSELTKQQLKIDNNILNYRAAMEEYAPLLKLLNEANRQYEHISRTGGKGKYRTIKSLIDILSTAGGGILGWLLGDKLQNELKNTNR